MRRRTLGILVLAGIAGFGTLGMGGAPLAVGQRVSVNFAGGKQGNVVKIGTAADGTYAGCTRIHFDYEGPDPTTGQWFCPWNSPFTITPLGGQPAGQPDPQAADQAGPPQPAEANRALAVGACVAVRGMQSPGRIIRVTPGGYVVQPQGGTAGDALNWAQEDVVTGPCPAGPTAAQLAQPHACPTTDAPNLNATRQSQGFLALIRSVMDHPAAPGMDGAVTITIQSVQVGAARRWTVLDSENFSADPSKPVYDLRVSFTSCTDFRTAIELRKQVSNFQCFTAPTGQPVCQMSASVNGLPEPTQRINK